MRFLKAFPGSDGGCCIDMMRANVCDPCCVDEFVCEGIYHIVDYADGMWGDVCPGAVTDLFPDWDGVFNEGVAGDNLCVWGIPSPVEYLGAVLQDTRFYRVSCL